MAEEIIDDPDRNGYAAANRDAIYRLITGSRADDLREIVRVLGGTREAARITGRSQRTVQRWITTTGTERIRAPRADARNAISTAFDQARNTRQGRERIAATRRATLMRHHGARMRGSAPAGPVSAAGTRAYIKSRVWTNYGVGADTMAATFDAYVAGGEEAAFGAFNQAFGDDYGGQGAFFDEFLFTDMTGLFFSPDTGAE
jgi:hypothetical protein